MAICRKYKKPDFFITFTSNPYWEEITRELREGETLQDRPDLVARVFKLKKDQLMNYIKKGEVIGKYEVSFGSLSFKSEDFHMHTSRLFLMMRTE